MVLLTAVRLLLEMQAKSYEWTAYVQHCIEMLCDGLHAVNAWVACGSIYLSDIHLLVWDTFGSFENIELPAIYGVRNPIVAFPVWILVFPRVVRMLRLPMFLDKDATKAFASLFQSSRYLSTWSASSDARYVSDMFGFPSRLWKPPESIKSFKTYRVTVYVWGSRAPESCPYKAGILVSCLRYTCWPLSTTPLAIRY